MKASTSPKALKIKSFLSPKASSTTKPMLFKSIRRHASPCEIRQPLGLNPTIMTMTSALSNAIINGGGKLDM